ncbi:MAG: VWA domain-containing protein, partial [Exilibacterium sp.]
MDKKQTLKKIQAAALGFFYAALGLAPATADDTDIFFGGVSNDVVKPNVLFILDNSNSMAYPIRGSGDNTSRIKLMKNAFKNIMDNATGINVGLMRFNDPGGSVMFPITDIDSEFWGDAASVPQIDQSSDDANENLASGGGDGSVNLDNDYLAFGFDPQSTTEVQAQASAGSDGNRAARTYNDSSRIAPVLKVSYHSGADSAQATGLRFQDVGIPQGATVTKAYIEFTPKTSSIPGDALSLNIKVEDSADAGQFKATSGDISSASYFSSFITWDAGDWVKHETVKTPDLTAMMQQVVDRTDWCGGNAMALKFQPKSRSSTAKRVAYSYDEGSAKQPRLIVEYNKNSIPNGACQQVTIRRQITERAGDAEQYPRYNRYINNDENTINLDGNQINGFRFTDVPLKPGARIQKAHLIFTASESDSGRANITLKVQDAVNPDNFSENRNDIGSRATLNNVKVNWNRASTPALTDWTKDLQYTSPDLSELIQPLVDNSSWNSTDNAIVFIQTLSGSDRHTYAWDRLPGAATALEVKVKTSDIASSAGDTTVRSHLISLVEQMEPRTYTPIVDSLYEAARYYRGDAVYWGKERKHAGVATNTDDRWKRVSNMNSLTGGTHFVPTGCTEDDFDSPNCAKEAITGNPVYLSPIKQGCQANYIVLLTDGEANKNNSASLIK